MMKPFLLASIGYGIWFQPVNPGKSFTQFKNGKTDKLTMNLILVNKGKLL